MAQGCHFFYYQIQHHQFPNRYHYNLLYQMTYLRLNQILVLYHSQNCPNYIFYIQCQLFYFPGFVVFLNNPIDNGLRFIGIVVLGGAGLSIVFTLMSAIAAKAQQNAALIAILGFPVILPQLLMLMRLSKAAFAEVFKEGAVLQLAGLIIGLDVLVIALAVILFPYLWKD